MGAASITIFVRGKIRHKPALASTISSTMENLINQTRLADQPIAVLSINKSSYHAGSDIPREVLRPGFSLDSMEEDNLKG